MLKVIEADFERNCRLVEKMTCQVKRNWKLILKSSTLKIPKQDKI